jgi:hypothetical protein
MKSFEGKVWQKRKKHVISSKGSTSNPSNNIQGSDENSDYGVDKEKR